MNILSAEKKSSLNLEEIYENQFNLYEQEVLATIYKYLKYFEKNDLQTFKIEYARLDSVED